MGGADTTEPDTTRHALLATVDRLDDGDDGAPIGEVVEEVADEWTAYDTCDKLAALIRHGDVYSPSSSTLRRIATDGGRVVGPHDADPPSPSFECGQCGGGYYGLGAARGCCGHAGGVV